MKAHGPPDIKGEIVEYFSSTLRVPIHLMARDVHVLELGADSIMLVEAQRWVKSRFDCVIEIHQFFDELNTIDLIAAFVAASTPRPATVLTEVAQSHRGQGVSDYADTQSRAESAPVARDEVGLMRSQLILLGEVIEEQNRLLKAMHRAKGGGR